MDKRKPGSVFQRAFFNQYNFILLGGSAVYALATGSWLPAVVGAGAEVLWLVLGADSAAFRRWVGKHEELWSDVLLNIRDAAEKPDDDPPSKDT